MHEKAHRDRDIPLSFFVFGNVGRISLRPRS
jgi:hypothetical protein